MEKFTPFYSLKNIPYPNLHNFTFSLTEKITDLINRLRWKAYFFLKSETRDEQRETYNFKTTNTAKPTEALKPFEADLFNLVKRIKFRKYTNTFQAELAKDMNNLKNSNKIWVKADKSTNIYKMCPNEYRRIIKDKISNTYKIDHNDTEDTINEDTRKMTASLGIEDRVGKIEMKNAYVLIKDHKKNFQNSKQTRLINTTKTELGHIAKKILQNAISETLSFTKFNLWKDSGDTIKWFKETNNKNKASFIQFDIVDFYPSISKELLNNSINYARNFSDISEEQANIILACRRSILVNNGENWIKKNNSDFDVPMGAFDSAQIADLVGIYIIYTLSRIVDPNQIGLYRDDGLIMIPNCNGPLISNIHKKICKAFKYLDLKIEITSNCKVVNFLDITLNLTDETYKPYHKENQIPTYINIKSNHPKCIIKQIPNTINTRINKLSSNKNIFDESKHIYDSALSNSGYKEKLVYVDDNIKKKRKNRKRKIIWFNPPYCHLSNINIGRAFLNLLDKHFTKSNPLHKIFNRKTVKISYSCTKNMDSIINSHNKKTLNTTINESKPKVKACNCQTKINCPLKGNCNVESVVYKATIFTQENKNNKKIYIGISAGKWKQRFYVHRHSFSNQNINNKTELAKYWWELKNKGLTPIIEWAILCKASTPSAFRQRCNLCLEEKIRILKYEDNNILNKRDELMAKCRHRHRFKITSTLGIKL